MILTSSISGLRLIGNVDEAWLCTNQPIEKLGTIQWHPELAPNDNLLNEWNALGRHAEDPFAWFNTRYVPKFLEQVSRNERARYALNDLVLADIHGSKVALLCYCKDPRICHRSVLAGMLYGAGRNVGLEGGLQALNGGYYERYLTAKMLNKR